MELILYLEPAPASPLRQHVDAFIKSTRTCSIASTACKYHCHISMTGFFNIPSEDTLPSTIAALDRLLQLRPDHAAASTILAEHEPPRIQSGPILVRKATTVHDPISNQERIVEQMPVHLLLPISVPPIYHRITNDFASCFNGVRPKSVDHISLAYWDEPGASDELHSAWCRHVLDDGMMDLWHRRAIETFGKGAPFRSADWDIVLYERTSKSTVVGVPHVFVEKKRWWATRRSSSHE